MSRVVRIGTRRSVLARARAEAVADVLRARHAGLAFEVVPLGADEEQADGALDHPATRDLVAEVLEGTLRARQVDLLVHSAAELPVRVSTDLPIAAILERMDRRDALVLRDGIAADGLLSLPRGARVATTSARRVCLLRALRPDLEVKGLRLAVGVSLARLDAGEVDAAVLSAAALDRLGLGHRIAERIDPERFVPAAGAGALALQARGDDVWTTALAGTLTHAPSDVQVRAERGVLARLGLGWEAPVAASATTMAEGKLRLVALIGAADGRRARLAMEGSAVFPEILGARIADELLGAGGAPLLAAALGRTPAAGA